MNRRDIKNKNKIGDTDIGTDNELQPLQGFSEGFSSNGVNQKFGKSPLVVNFNRLPCAYKMSSKPHQKVVRELNSADKKN